MYGLKTDADRFLYKEEVSNLKAQYTSITHLLSGEYHGPGAHWV